MSNNLCSDVTKLIWSSTIPVEFVLSEYEFKVSKILISDSTVNWEYLNERPLFLMVNRMTYLPLLLGRIKEHYKVIFDSLKRAKIPWFSILLPNGASMHDDLIEIPLSWHLPVGLLFDEFNLQNSSKSNIPWKIYLRFLEEPPSIFPLYQGDHPTDLSILSDQSSPVASHFYSMIKQSDQIRYNGGRGIKVLDKKDQMLLWEYFASLSLNNYWSIFSRVIGKGIFSSIPSRFYEIPDSKKPTQKNVHQYLIEPGMMIGDAIKMISNTNLIPYIHGIEIPLITPMLYLMNSMIFMDGFLHILLLPSNNN